MNRHLDDVGESGVVGGENGLHIADHLFGLLFDRIARQLAGGRIDWACSGYENKVSGAPAL